MSLDDVKERLLDHPRIVSILSASLALAGQAVVVTMDVGAGGNLGP